MAGLVQEKYDMLENGILEKIINLSFFNLRHYCACEWRIIAARSRKSIQRLYRLSNYLEDVIDSDAVLIVVNCAPEENAVEHFRCHNDLVSMSIMYAAKFYGVRFKRLDTLDRESLRYEFNIGEGEDISSVICLGGPNRFELPLHLGKKRVYKDVVCEI